MAAHVANGAIDVPPLRQGPDAGGHVGPALAVTAATTAPAARKNDSTPLPGTLRIGVLHNPGSGANVKAPASIRRVLDAHPDTPHRDVPDARSVARALDELAREGANTVAISGGDGTVQAVLSAIFSGRNPCKDPPALAVLRAGTTNMIAGDVGLAGPPTRALNRLLERAPRGPAGLVSAERHILRVDRGPGRLPICGMHFGAAAIVQGIAYCTDKLHRVGLRGEIGPGITAARFLLAMARGRHDVATPVPVAISLDGTPTDSTDRWVLQVTTLNRLFLGMRPFWGIEAAPLRYTSVREKPKHLLRALPALLRGRRNRILTEDNGYASHNVHRLELTLDSRFVVDGEIFEPTRGSPLTITDAGTVTFLKWR